jgi:hypothetical protein
VDIDLIYTLKKISELLYKLVVYRQSVSLGDKPLETHEQYFFFQLNTCGHSPYITSSLTRGWVCRLQLLLDRAGAVILRSESRGNHDHIRDLPTGRARSPYLYHRETGWPSYTRRHWVPFSSPLTHDILLSNIEIQFVPQRKHHSISVAKINRLMLFRLVITVWATPNTQCGQSVIYAW